MRPNVASAAVRSLVVWVVGCSDAEGRVDSVVFDAGDVGSGSSQADVDASPDGALDVWEVGDVGGTEAVVTWYGDLGPVLERHCLGCHAGNSAAPIDLRDWSQVEQHAEQIVAAVSSARMPPWPLDVTCAPVEGARVLSAAERALFGAWRDGGFERGEEVALVAEPMADRFAALGAPDEVLRPDAPFEFDPRDVDVQAVTEFALGNSTGRWLRAVRIVPSALSITHHGQVDGLVQNAESGETEVFSYFVAGWAPGFDGVVFSADAPMYVPAQAVLRLDMHYSSVALGVDGPPIADSTEIHLWWSDLVEPAFESVSYSPMRQGFVIEAGDPRREVFAEGRFERAGEVVSVAPHMHLYGTSISLWVGREAERECVVDVIEFDFWQHGIHELRADSRVAVDAGTPWSLRCVYDNSAANQPMVGGVISEPRDVRQGGTTLDEMCVVATVLRVPRLTSVP